MAKTGKSLTCLACGAEIAAAAKTCGACGWSWLDNRAVPPKNLPCPLCAGAEFAWGHLDGDHAVMFKSGERSVLEMVTGLGREPVRARKCRRCGNLQLFVSPSDPDEWVDPEPV